MYRRVLVPRFKEYCYDGFLKEDLFDGFDVKEVEGMTTS